METILQVGFARLDITPQTPTPLDGMGKDYERQAAWIPPTREEDKLKATLVALSDGQTPVLFCLMDTLFIHEQFCLPGAKAIADATGIAADHVFFCASHTHSGVSMDEPDPSVTQYLDWLYEELPRAAKKAMADLCPAQIRVGSLETVGMNAQRRYILKDGTHRSTVHDKSFAAQDVKGYETEPDRTLRAVRFVRRDKPHVLLANWQAHVGFAAKEMGMVSADAWGTIREYFEQEEPNCYFGFVQGTEGNMSKASRNPNDPGYEKAKALDREGYSKAFVSLLRQMPMQTVRAGEISVRRALLTVKKRVQGVVTEQDQSLGLGAVCLGDVAFATVPGEAFSDTGLQIRRGSPYKMTFVCGCCNGNSGYLPLEECFAADPQNQTFEVRVSKCQPGTAEKIAQTLIALLNQ